MLNPSVVYLFAAALLALVNGAFGDANISCANYSKATAPSLPSCRSYSDPDRRYAVQHRETDWESAAMLLSSGIHRSKQYCGALCDTSAAPTPPGDIADYMATLLRAISHGVQLPILKQRTRCAAPPPRTSVSMASS